MKPPAPPADSDEWLTPPVGADDSPCVVDMRFAVFKVDDIESKTLSANIKIAAVWYWTDPRLVGWKDPLPKLLWGPQVSCVNSRVNFHEKQCQFELVDGATGRLKRGHMFHGQIDNDMDLRKSAFS